MQANTDKDYKPLYEQSQLRIEKLEHELHQLKKMIFGSRHERFVPSVDPYEMDDNLHMRDLKHTMVGDDRRSRNVPTDPDRRKEDLGGQPK